MSISLFEASFRHKWWIVVSYLLFTCHGSFRYFTNLLFGYIKNILRYYPRYVFTQRGSCKGSLVGPICCYAWGKQIVAELTNSIDDIIAKMEIRVLVVSTTRSSDWITFAFLNFYNVKDHLGKYTTTTTCNSLITVYICLIFVYMDKNKNAYYTNLKLTFNEVIWINGRFYF